MRNKQFLQKWVVWKLTPGNQKHEAPPRDVRRWMTMAVRGHLWTPSEGRPNEEATRPKVTTSGVVPHQIADSTTMETTPNQALVLPREQEQCHPMYNPLT